MMAVDAVKVEAPQGANSWLDFCVHRGHANSIAIYGHIIY